MEHRQAFLELRKEAVRRKKELSLFTVGHSMYPLISSNSWVTIIEPDIHQLRLGDLIVFQNPNGKGIIGHRIIGVNKKQGSRIFLTKGDNGRWGDEIEANYVIGKIININGGRSNSKLWTRISWIIALFSRMQRIISILHDRNRSIKDKLYLLRADLNYR